jgi:hypothetical protein
MCLPFVPQAARVAVREAEVAATARSAAHEAQRALETRLQELQAWEAQRVRWDKSSALHLARLDCH